MSAVTITSDVLRGMALPEPDEDGDKEERGLVMVVAGSVQVPGAALLAGIAALRVGAGKLRIASCRSTIPHLGLFVPEARVFGIPETADGAIAPEAATMLLPHAQHCDAVLVGPGMMDEDAVAALTLSLLQGTDEPAFVLDAAALAKLRDARDLLHRHTGRVVITPHPGEMAGMLAIDRAAVEADPLGTARHAAKHLQAVVVLKGRCTHIVTPDGKAWVYEGGRIGLATSGSGDTLAGFIAGLLARGATPVQAGIWGVYLHGEAGNRLAQSHGPLGFLARELLAEVPRLLAEGQGAS